MIAIALNERVRNEFNLTLSMERLYNSTLSETFTVLNKTNHSLEITMSNNIHLSEEELANFHKNGYIGPITIYSPERNGGIWSTVRRQLPDRSNAALPLQTRTVRQRIYRITIA
ncbi:hypothetical protein KIF59_14270 [Enterobacter cloacae subsp. cloacae]|nr:hypothetical protein [Enterobacter cloacae subsp. cloacae]